MEAGGQLDETLPLCQASSLENILRSSQLYAHDDRLFLHFYINGANKSQKLPDDDRVYATACDRRGLRHWLPRCYPELRHFPLTLSKWDSEN